MIFTLENKAVSFDGGAAVEVVLYGQRHGSFIARRCDGELLYNLTNGYPHTINDTVCNDFEEFLSAWVASGGQEDDIYHSLTVKIS